MSVAATRRWLIAGIIAGTMLMLAPLAGMLATVPGMTRAFSVLGSPGMADPEKLSASIGGVLVFSFAGFATAPLGVALLALSITFLVRLRRKTAPNGAAATR
jgi:biopolymer transport protein ExbB/TolQ